MKSCMQSSFVFCSVILRNDNCRSICQSIKKCNNNAAFPTKRPTITVSTVVYNCWIKVPSMIGKKNIRSCFQIIPSVIVFSSIFFFPKFFSSLTCKFLACLDFQAFRIFEWYNLSLSSFNISLLFMHKVYNIILIFFPSFSITTSKISFSSLDKAGKVLGLPHTR